MVTKLLQDGWTIKTGMDEEGQTHRSHNINTNFDNIEINGPYFESIQKALNKVFTKEINRQNYEDEDIEELKYLFRLYDPSDLLLQTVQKPTYVNWLGENLTDEQFLNFEDIEGNLANYQTRDDSWITLYEDGHQRTNDDITARSKRTVYFNVSSR